MKEFRLVFRVVIGGCYRDIFFVDRTMHDSGKSYKASGCRQRYISQR